MKQTFKIHPFPLELMSDDPCLARTSAFFCVFSQRFCLNRFITKRACTR